MRWRALVLVISVATLLSAPGAALGAIIVVTSNDDSLEANGDCTLREAVEAANTNTAVDGCAKGSGPDTIVLGPTVYEIAIAPSGPNDNDTGDFNVTGPTTIRGSGPATVVDARQLDRAFRVDTPSQSTAVVFEDLTVRNGLATGGGDGGGIFGGAATLTVRDVNFPENEAVYGGGLWTARPRWWSPAPLSATRHWLGAAASTPNTISR